MVSGGHIPNIQWLKIQASYLPQIFNIKVRYKSWGSTTKPASPRSLPGSNGFSKEGIVDLSDGSNPCSVSFLEENHS